MNVGYLVRWAAVTAAVLALLTACATPAPPVRADYDHAVNFNSYRTFGFPPTTGTDRGGYETLATSHFKEAVRREMTVRGYTYTETAPDLLVNFYTEFHDKTEVYSYPGWAMGSWGFYRGHPRYGYYNAWPYYGPDIDVVQYKAGTLKLDVVDAARKHIVWEASVEERLTDESQDNSQPLIDRLVTEMFRRFPRGVAAQ
jgi:hypothetical protein